MYLLFRFTLRCQFVKKKKTGRNQVKLRSNYFVTFFLPLLEQSDDQGMRDGKAVHDIRDSCYYKENGAEKTWGRGGGRDGRKHIKGMMNHQLQNFTPLGLVS